MLEIRKKGYKNFFHYWSELPTIPFSASDGSITYSGETVFLNKINGAPVFLKEGFNIVNVSIYDDTVSGIQETFTNTIDLAQRLISLGYPFYYEDGEFNIINGNV